MFFVGTYLFVCEKTKKAVPLGIGLFVFFLLLTSDIRLGLAVTGSSVSFASSSSVRVAF